MSYSKPTNRDDQHRAWLCMKAFYFIMPKYMALCLNTPNTHIGNVSS